MLYALSLGVFREVRFLGLGIQIDVNHLAMSDTQMALLCILGAAATAAAGCVLVLLRKKICQWESKFFRIIPGLFRENDKMGGLLPSHFSVSKKLSF